MQSPIQNISYNSENDSISCLFPNDLTINLFPDESIIRNNESEEIPNNENILLSNSFNQNARNENSTGVSNNINFIHKKRGRKKKGEEIQNESHNKFSFDNKIRKTKHLVCKNLTNFLNQKIYYIYKGKIGHGSNKKQFILGKHAQISNGNIEFNKKFLQKPLKEIFSVELSGSVKNYPKDHNKKLIEILINEDDLEKREYYKGFFNLTFIDYLKYYISVNDDNECLYIKGSKRFIDLENDAEFIEKNGEEYIKNLREFMEGLEQDLKNRKGRRSRVNKV